MSATTASFLGGPLNGTSRMLEGEPSEWRVLRADQPYHNASDSCAFARTQIGRYVRDSAVGMIETPYIWVGWS